MQLMLEATFTLHNRHTGRKATICSGSHNCTQVGQPRARFASRGYHDFDAFAPNVEWAIHKFAEIQGLRYFVRNWLEVYEGPRTLIELGCATDLPIHVTIHLCTISGMLHHVCASEAAAAKPSQPVHLEVLIPHVMSCRHV